MMAPDSGSTPRSARSRAPPPFLPGYTVTNPMNQAKPLRQTLTYGPGGATDTKQPPKPTVASGGVPQIPMHLIQQMRDPNARFAQSERSTTHDEREALKDSARNTYRPANAPAWLKHDRQVLRFFAYFQEPVHETPKENFRVRKCAILYYLEDGTMMVSEPKVENSGISQGTFVKRHRVPRSRDLGGGHYSYEDLKVGSTITIYSRVFQIVDADDFTREYYDQAFGITLEPGGEAPLDAFAATALAAPESPVFSIAPHSRNEIAEGKAYNELALGGHRKNLNLQQYLENDRKVLCFKCYWDDTTRYGARMYYTLHYYLADDTVDLQESLARNSGRDPYPAFWKRSPLRKNPYVSPAPCMEEPTPVIHKPEDFIVGSCVKVYGRDFFLYDCDDFTRDFYRKYMDVEQDTYTINEPAVRHTKLSCPPHSGFGTEEDSMASCLHLTPRLPRRDVNKLMDNADRTMRFEAAMETGARDDARRRFVVTLHLADDSVSVWERRQKNSGHDEGRFAARARIKNPSTGRWFTPQDFFVGATVTVSAVPFRLLQADEATMRHMEERSREFPASNPRLILSKLAELRPWLESSSELTEVSTAELRLQADDRLGVRLTDHELATLVRALGDCSTPSGLISKASLLEHLPP